MQKIRKILRAVSEKTALPTNYYQQHRSYRTSLTPVQKLKPRTVNYRDNKSFSNNTFREYLLFKLSMENIRPSAYCLEKFLGICVSTSGGFASRKRKSFEEITCVSRIEVLRKPTRK